MSYWWIAVWALAAMAAAGIFGKKMDKGEMIDSGFVFCFWKVSYRRRFLRTIYIFPLGLIMVFLLHTMYKDLLFTSVIGGEFLAAFIIQAVYYYKKWKM